MNNPWAGRPQWLRWSSVAAFLGAVVLLAQAKDAAPALEAWVPATHGFVVEHIRLAGDVTTASISDVRIKLLDAQIKEGVKYRLDLSIQELDLRDRLAQMTFTDPTRANVNTILAGVLAAIETSKSDEHMALCERARILGVPSGCSP